MNITDRSIERTVSVLLLWGVILSGTITLLGGAIFLAHHWREPVSYQQFHSQPRIDRIIPEIFSGALHLRGRSVIQFGLLLLIATPVARVAWSLVGFALERDRKFVIITTIVLLVLLYSLISGALTN
ncbi:MAG TPA: DUF1634 domain-containing protein [Bryobacteraceae bacterium]|jgi:uncharacterized membrane protein|nr:DUF1634 domain-containing protein [Bryobacteraceae bacterium]